MTWTLPSSEELTNDQFNAPAVIRKDNDGCRMSGSAATAASIRQRGEWTSARLITRLMVVSNWLVSLVTKWCAAFTTPIHLAGGKSSRSYLFRMWSPCYMCFIIGELLVHASGFLGLPSTRFAEVFITRRGGVVIVSNALQLSSVRADKITKLRFKIFQHNDWRQTVLGTLFGRFYKVELERFYILQDLKNHNVKTALQSLCVKMLIWN